MSANERTAKRANAWPFSSSPTFHPDWKGALGASCYGTPRPRGVFQMEGHAAKFVNLVSRRWPVSHDDVEPFAPTELHKQTRFEWEKLIRRLIVPSSLRAVKVVAYTLATYADADGTNVRPGEKRLMLQCQLSERTVRDCLRFLREAGLLYRWSRGSNLGRTNYVDVYQLSKPKVIEMLALHPDDSEGDAEAACPPAACCRWGIGSGLPVVGRHRQPFPDHRQWFP